MFKKYTFDIELVDSLGLLYQVWGEHFADGSKQGRDLTFWRAFL